MEAKLLFIPIVDGNHESDSEARVLTIALQAMTCLSAASVRVNEGSDTRAALGTGMVSIALSMLDIYPSAKDAMSEICWVAKRHGLKLRTEPIDASEVAQ